MNLKVYWLVYSIFVTESLLLLLGIELDIVSYGVDVATPLTKILLILCLVFFSVLTFVPVLEKQREYLIYRIFVTVFTALVSASFLLNAKFLLN